MTTSLSEEEFNRLQTQLIELKSTNYSLEEKCRKQQAESAILKHQLEDFEKELSKAQKALSRSKRAREVDQLIQENDIIQRKLQSQEDEFRLQNTTLMQELSNLIETNERVEKELAETRLGVLKNGHGDENGKMQEEVRRLQAEVLALQKSLHESRQGYEAEISSLRDCVRHSISNNTQHNSCAESDSKQCDNIENGEPIVDIVAMLKNAEITNADLKQQLKHLEDCKLKLDTEVEEKKMLQQQITDLEKHYNQKFHVLQEENAKWSDKLKRKQESFLQLQQEKEQQYSESKQAYVALRIAKDQEIEKLQELCQRIQRQLNNLMQVQQEQKDKAAANTQLLESQIAMMKETLSRQSAEAVEAFKAENASLQSAASEMKTALDDAQRENQLLNCQLEELQASVQNFQAELQQLEEEKKKNEAVAVEAGKLADKRKMLIDDMARHLQDMEEKHKTVLAQMKETYATQLSKLAAELEENKQKVIDLEEVQKSMRTQENQIKLLLDTQKQLEQTVLENEDNLAHTNSHYQAVIEKMQHDHVENLTALGNDKDRQIQEINSHREVLLAENTTLDEQVRLLRQEIKDNEEEYKIHQKKGLTMVKELKRQLLVERKRAEKLQERLQEILSESPHNQSVDDILHSVDACERTKGDASSISSWSFMSGNLDNSREAVNNNVTPPIDASHPHSRTSPSALEQDNHDLLGRLAAIQEEKWVLEEKINHLEVSNAAMAEDLIQKTEIIQYYCMEGRPDPHPSPSSDKLTVKRVVDFIKDKGDENLREINRRMQRMLEETLTKNMHLQQHLETLSDEVVHLRKSSESKGSDSEYDIPELLKPET